MLMNYVSSFLSQHIGTNMIGLMKNEWNFMKFVNIDFDFIFQFFNFFLKPDRIHSLHKNWRFIGCPS